MSQPADHYYEFGPFRLDPAEHVLLREGQLVPLTPKALETLWVLVEHRGHVVDKDELMRKVWPDTFVEEVNLAKNVSTLRKTLGGGESEQGYIETIPKRGYRFVASVREVSASPQVEEGGGTDHSRPKTKSRQVIVGLTLALFVVSVTLVIVYAVYRSRTRSAQASPFQKMKVTRFTNGGTWVPTISPDGKFVAYIANGTHGQPSVWIREVSTGHASQLVPADGFNYGGLSFSRDSNYVYCEQIDLKNQSDNFLGDIYRIPVIGGTPRLVASKISGVFPSPDNTQLVSIRFNPGKKQNELIVINADGAGERVIASRHWPDLSWGPSWSPDGRLIAFCARNRDGDRFYNTVMAVPTGGGPEIPLTQGRWMDVGGALWLPDGGGLLITAREKPGDAFQIYSVSYPGGEVRRVTNDVNSYSALGITADGKTLVAEVADLTANIWVLPEGDSARARQITSGGKDGVGGLAWTPDGRIVYATITRDTYNETGAIGDKALWVVNPGGGNPERLTADDEIDANPAITPDGRYVVFSSYRNGGWGIWRAEIDGHDPKQLAGGGTMTSPACSPDSQWVVFRRLGPSAAPHLWRVPIEGGEATELSEMQASAPSVSPDGKLVAFFSNGETKINLVVIPAAGGEPVRVYDNSTDTRYVLGAAVVRWTPDGRLLTYIDNGAEASNIWGQPTDGGTARQLTKFDAGAIFSFAWAPDGQQLAVARGQYNRQIVLLEDFR